MYHSIFLFTIQKELLLLIWCCALEYLLKKKISDTIDVSRLFIYDNACVKDGQTEGKVTDSGCTVPSAIKA
ncbi:unnamed protein product [Rotaria sp. Silwood2]|nr:unnamed protein product [Rotaria sp. Silwood2]CAF3161858.1 unnamed protein product [Rotaria sp. Silwood2]CAF4216689.1 unnamed protein product [Rotaria sp. Silwood2]CAF4581491.1 unnamed protein product [Rotaria sp. Silwood2]